MTCFDFLYQKFLENGTVCIDSRNIKKGAVFFSIKGANFDGHLFAKEALEKGASAVVVAKPIEQIDKNKIFLVKNTLQTLQKLANHHRKKLGIPIIAITGSNGKTTTKELLYSALSKGYNTFATQGNLNNHIGVPLTLLSMNSKTDIGIVEMGANHQGEIAELCNIAEPDYGYITNFGSAHLEGFGGVEGVIKGKSELYQYLAKNHQKAFVNQQDAKQMELTKDMQRILIDTKAPYDICEKGFIKIKTPSHVKTNLTGVYNVANILTAMGIGAYFKINPEKIKEAIATYQPKNNRSQIINSKGRKIILDAYNANPSSMKAALENLSKLTGNFKVAILADMFELGDESSAAHQEIATLAANIGLQELHFVGSFFKGVMSEKGIKHKNTEALIKYLSKNSIPPKSTVLIKGSRGMELEKILPFLK